MAIKIYFTNVLNSRIFNSYNYINNTKVFSHKLTLLNCIIDTKYAIICFFIISDRMKELEMECIDLLQPIDDIIFLKRELKRLIEVESNYMKLLKNIENNINT